MTRLRLFVLIALAACWLPATLHCALEAAEIVGSHCCESEDVGPTPDNCREEMCCAWESALARPAADLPLKAPDAATMSAICAAVFVDPVFQMVEEPVPDHPRPVWISTWQFERRTALPVRAPALS